MFAFPTMIVIPAEKAGMKVPPNPDDFDRDIYPHFSVFCAVQLHRELVYWGEAWDNANIIVRLSDVEIRSMTLSDLISIGLVYPAIIVVENDPGGYYRNKENEQISCRNALAGKNLTENDRVILNAKLEQARYVGD